MTEETITEETITENVTETDADASVERKYEMMLLLSGSLSEADVEKTLAHLKSVITEKGGDVFYEDNWGMQKIAYRIKGEDNGYYIVWNFTLEPQHLKDLDQTVRLDNTVLRHLLMNVPSSYKVTKFDDEATAKLEEVIFGKKEDKKPKKGARKPAVKAKPVPVETPAVKVVTPEPVVAEAPSPEEAKDQLEAVDEKLAAIMSDEDLNL